MATRIDFSKLSTQERLDLIEELWASVDPAEVPPPSAELLAEMERRVQDALEHPTAATPWDVLHARLRERLQE